MPFQMCFQGVQLDRMITEVDTALELMQDPVLNPLKLEQAMTNAAHLTKSMSLRWEAGKVVKDPGGFLVVYPPTLHLEKYEGEASKKEQVFEEDGKDDDADVVVEENNNEGEETCGTCDLSLVNGSTSKERNAAARGHHENGAIEDMVAVLDVEAASQEFKRSYIGPRPSLLKERCLSESSEYAEPQMEQNPQELSRSSDLNVSIKASPLTSSPSNQVETFHYVQQAEHKKQFLDPWGSGQVPGKGQNGPKSVSPMHRGVIWRT